MAHLRPLAGIRYSRNKGLDLSALIAPPYDVLDESGKSRLQAASPYNIVTVDLPHLPAKSAGPDEVYHDAAQTLQSWLNDGVLQREARPAIYPYTQVYDHGGRTYHRRGLIALVRLVPFGQGDVVPHEKTYPGPIEDRFKLMQSTGMQLSPIFGLFSDPRHEVNDALYRNLGRPDVSATLEGVRNDLWHMNDSEVENTVIDWFVHKPIYIADGHHRYTTALHYQAWIEQQSGGPLPPTHPANFCMFVLVSMQDDGLLILPTHRLVGGLENMQMPALLDALAGQFEIEQSPIPPDGAAEFAEQLNQASPHTFGLFDARGKRLYTLRLKNPQILQPLEPTHSDAWRSLDVAILQRYLLDELLKPKFAGGDGLTLGYTADPAAIPAMADGKKFQIALLLKPTPLHALEELGKHGEVMPQKSTYFFPKLATGMVLNPLK